jgi:hypothetical protein
VEQTKNTRVRITEAFSSNGCPLCTMLQKDEFNSLCQWVGRSNNNAKDCEQIKQLIDAGGFCSYHFWRFSKICTHYGIANIAGQLIEKLLEILKTTGRKYFVDTLEQREKASEFWLVECPLCFELNEKENVYLKELTAVLKEDGYKSKYEKSCGLCMPHYRKIIGGIGNDSLPRFLFETEINQLEKIKTAAAGLVDKSEPPLRWEQTEDEKKSWFLSVEKIVGRSCA